MEDVIDTHINFQIITHNQINSEYQYFLDIDRPTHLPGIYSDEIAIHEKNTLHSLRDNIAKYERVNGEGTWEYYKKCVNPYEFVYTQKRYVDFPDSVSMLHPLSRSYFKMIEMIQVSDFIKNMNLTTPIKLHSAHVCEGPGGFIEGFIDVCLNHRISNTSIAMTLRPTEYAIPGWKRATHFMRRNKSVRLSTGKDGTGDILVLDNQEVFIKECVPKVDIFTGDGGFDFSTDYNSQELSVFPLIIATARIGLNCLAPGGYFIVKLFDFYNSATLEFIYFISLHFESWAIYKPAMSRPCNPEQYFIGRGFQGLNSQHDIILKTWLAEWDTFRLYNVSNIIPTTEFVSYITNIRTKSFMSQVKYLNNVFRIIEDSEVDKNRSDREIRQLLKKHELQSYEWCKLFNIPICYHRSRLIEESHTGRQGAGLQ